MAIFWPFLAILSHSHRLWPVLLTFFDRFGQKCPKITENDRFLGVFRPQKCSIPVRFSFILTWVSERFSKKPPAEMPVSANSLAVFVLFSANWENWPLFGVFRSFSVISGF